MHNLRSTIVCTIYTIYKCRMMKRTNSEKLWELKSLFIRIQISTRWNRSFTSFSIPVNILYPIVSYTHSTLITIMLIDYEILLFLTRYFSSIFESKHQWANLPSHSQQRVVTCVLEYKFVGHFPSVIYSTVQRNSPSFSFFTFFQFFTTFS